jgi:Flp pilus assembly protein TadG
LALRNRNKSRGSTLVESALSLLLLLTLVFGIIEFGHLFNVYQVMTNAAREGARFAVAPCPFTASIGSTCTAGQLPSTSAVQNYVQGFLNSGSVSCPGGGVSCVVVNPSYQPSTDPVNGATLSYTQVTISVPYTFYFFTYTPTITTNAVMRNETN